LGLSLLIRSAADEPRAAFDRSPDVVQEGFHILLGRLNAPFPVRIPAHMLTEKIKAVFHMRDGLSS
jgi:hypothetical protein